MSATVGDVAQWVLDATINHGLGAGLTVREADSARVVDKITNIAGREICGDSFPGSFEVELAGAGLFEVRVTRKGDPS